MGGAPQFAASQFLNGASSASWAHFAPIARGFSSESCAVFSIYNLFLVNFCRIHCSNSVLLHLDFFTGVIYMLRRHFVLRPSQILTPNCNFILTGSGIATILRQQILEFLYTAGDRSIQCLCHCSTAVFCASVNWIQVDTPSVADDIESDEH